MPKQKPRIIDEIRSQEALETLANSALESSDLVQTVEQSFFGNQNEEFYKGLFCAYSYATDIGIANNPSSYTTKILGEVTLYLAHLLVEQKFEQEPRQNKGFMYDQPIDSKRIPWLVNQAESLNADKVNEFKNNFNGDQSPDFYRGFISGLEIAHQLVLKSEAIPKKHIFLRELLQYVTSQVHEII